MFDFAIYGGAGFIGSHLIKHYIKKKNKVLCIDNFSTGNLQNIKSLLSNKNLSLLKHDVIKKKKIKSKVHINLACPASPIQYQKNPINTFKTSVLGSINILDNALETDSIVFQASTSEVYGDPLMHPQREDYWGNVNPIGKRSCYDEGKRAAETIFFDYSRQNNSKIKVARIFNTYGPLMQKNDGRVISNFIMQALENKNITIYGKGNQTRSFCYVDDLIRGIDSFIFTKKKITGPINLGNDSEYTINQIAKIILKICKSKSKIVYRSLPEDDPRKRRPSLKNSKKYLKWTPKVSIEEGLNQTINYFKNL